MKGKLMNNLKEKVNRIQELRRSNAATAIPNKKKYNRKQKHKNKYDF
jgi:vacuolar-type H+-ATPase subunit F/Vma7